LIDLVIASSEGRIYSSGLSILP